MNCKKIAAGLLALCLIAGLAGCSGSTEDETTLPEGTAVEVQAVSFGSLEAASRVNGTVSSGKSVSVYAPNSAKVLSVPVEVGDSVSAGQILYVMDTDKLADSYALTLRSYNSTKSMYEAQIQLYTQQLQNTKELFDIGAASQLEVDQAQLTLLSAQTQADTTLAQLEDTLNTLTDTMNDSVVTAPIAGVVSALNVKEGDMVSPAVASAVVSEPEKFQIDVSVSEVILPKIQVGDEANVTFAALDDTTIACTIRSIAPAASQLTSLYSVVLDIPESDTAQLTDGMFASVEFSTDSVDNAVVVPTQAILNDGDTQYVFILSDDGTTAHRVDVQTGLVGNGMTEITSGLEGGETLVVTGQSYLTEGTEVRVVSTPGSTADSDAAQGTEASS